MHSAIKYLLLWLEGPLQSWGDSSRFDVRNTLNFPTRSGVLGLICCARGAGGPEIEWLNQMQNKRMEVRAFSRTDKDGVPIPPEPTLCDFHMVGSGYDYNDPWQNLLTPKKEDGRKPTGFGSKMTYRHYLQDSAFAVVLEIGREQEESLSEVLQNPVWDLCLGRKNCIPTELIFQGVFHEVEDAWDRANELARHKDKAYTFRVMEGEHDGDIVALNDVPIQFGADKRYRDRLVTIQYAE